MTRTFVGLGSNVGDRLSWLRRAVAALAAADEIEVVARSPVYETDPVGPPQPDYLNAVVEIRTALGPRELARRLKAIEAEVGRQPGERWGPREIDLDLLLYGDERIAEEGLVVPHAHMTERAFVLVPLAEIAPDVEIPGAGRVSDLIRKVDRSGVRPAWSPDALCP